MSQQTANPRLQLLAGLRTAGRSGAVPQTAAPGVSSFNVPRIPSGLNASVFPPEEDDGFDDHQSVFATHSAPRMPMTAAVDGPGFMHQQQQPQHQLNPTSAPFTPFMAQSPQVNNNPAFQMQLMQLELMKMQAAQQQYQAQILAQAQMQQHQMQTPRRVSYNPPATAGPLNTSFDLRSATLSAQMRRAAQTGDDQVPMTASLDGKFGGRLPFNDSVPGTPTTTVISGGTSLGSPASNNGTPSKSDSVSSWRRGGNNNSVLSGNNRSPSVKVTPPPAENALPASPAPLGKFRPQPLSFNAAPVSVPQVTIATADGENEDDDTSSSDKSSDPTTPPAYGPPLSPREEASKKLYEGLGIGRPVAAEQSQPRTASQPVRQPRGPPQAADELGPKNFATRIRRKAIGGLGALMTSRERRAEPDVVVEAF